MQLKNFIMILSAITMLLSGFCILVGSRKKERKFTKFYFLSVFFGTIYTISILAFLNLPLNTGAAVKYLGYGIFLAPVLMDIFLLSYILYPFKLFRGFSVFLATLFFLFISFILTFDTADFYNGFSLSTDGNSFNIVSGPIYLSYILFFVISSVFMIIGLLLRAKQIRSLNTKHGLIFLTISGALLRILMVVFGIILPFIKFELIYLSPIMLSLMVILDYYAVLRFQILMLSSRALKVLSYVILVTTAGTAYMLIFYAIITFLFKIRGLSTEIYILTFIMVTILLLILPIMSEVLSFIRSLILKDQVYLAYLLKKMNKMSGKVDADALAEFLASNLHFNYVGIVIGKKVHGSKVEEFSEFEISELNALAEPERGVWQKIDAGTQKILDEHKIKAVAAMFDAKGNVFGQILVGEPTGKEGFERRDLAQLELVINLVSAMIDSRAK
ncbi:MAG: hypothetical protein Q4E70_01665 [Candidatus Saccharibacteria bacterium]|nr:hypothetical protein [Candidatus Saccharibacteria bacterium]